jgi:hypothetical protein
MNKTVIIFYLICGTMLLSVSCSYKPQLTAIPLLEEKGDLQLDGYLSPITFSASATASYAITNHFAAQVFGDIGGSNMIYGQGALGYFNRFNNRLVIESYTGFGSGHFKYNHNADPSWYNGNYYLGFTQFNIGKRVSNRLWRFDYGAGVKIGYLLHDVVKKYSDPVLDSENEWIDVTSYYKISRTVIEPNLFFRIGGERLKFSVQGNYCFFYQWNHKDESLFGFPINTGLGVSYRFSTIRKK